MPTSARQLLCARQSGDRTQLHPRRRGGLNIRPEPGASTASPVYNAPGFGRAIRAPTTGAVGAAVRTGGYAIRPYRPAIGLFVGADAHIGPPAVACKAVRPTRFGGGAVGIAGLFGRIFNPPLHAPAAVSRRRGGYQPPGTGFRFALGFDGSPTECVRRGCIRRGDAHGAV